MKLSVPAGEHDAPVGRLRRRSHARDRLVEVADRAIRVAARILDPDPRQRPASIAAWTVAATSFRPIAIAIFEIAVHRQTRDPPDQPGVLQMLLQGQGVPPVEQAHGQRHRGR